MSRNDADAEEITQETFLRCFRSLDSFHGDSRFGTWLYRVAMNEALMRLRAERRRPTQSLEGVQALAGDPSADDLVDDKRLLERVREALGRIDEARRAALVLRDLEELSAEEAGEILGVSPETVRQRAHRARLELCASLADVMSAHSPRGGRGAGNATLRAVP
jgi:RNA polymerase sigma-70 factor (ECF subfamily)